MARQSCRELVLDLVRRGISGTLMHPPTRLDPLAQLSNMQGDTRFLEDYGGGVMKGEAHKVAPVRRKWAPRVGPESSLRHLRRSHQSCERISGSGGALGVLGRFLRLSQHGL